LLFYLFVNFLLFTGKQKEGKFCAMSDIANVSNCMEKDPSNVAYASLNPPPQVNDML